MTGSAGARVYLDTSVLVEAFDGTEAKAKHLSGLLLLLRASPQQAITSDFTLAEVLGRESDKGWTVQKRFFDAILGNGLVSLVPASREILLETGTWRRAGRQSGRKIALPDAIHVVTAAKVGWAHLLSSDKRMAVPAPVRLVDPHALGYRDFERMLDA